MAFTVPDKLLMLHLTAPHGINRSRAFIINLRAAHSAIKFWPWAGFFNGLGPSLPNSY